MTLPDLITRLRELNDPDATLDVASARFYLRQAADEIEKLRSALKSSEAAIASLSKCGVRSKIPCRSCEVHAQHGLQTIRAALGGEG